MNKGERSCPKGASSTAVTVDRAGLRAVRGAAYDLPFNPQLKYDGCVAGHGPETRAPGEPKTGHACRAVRGAEPRTSSLQTHFALHVLSLTL